MFLDRYANLIQGLARDVTALGSSPFYGYIWLLFLAVDPRVSLDLLLTFALLMAISYAIKALWFKPRPDHVEGVVHDNVLEQVDASSFPSAHSARAAAMAWIVIGAVEAGPALASIVILGALATGGSRVVLRRHSVGDVLGGFAIGVVAAVAVEILGP
ncbi:MAG: hypothetical protein CME06_13785 [Gemmatimonadetes bacterium]|nr:hypothetical protein [Gemmatimonadota bacterium]